MISKKFSTTATFLNSCLSRPCPSCNTHNTLLFAHLKLMYLLPETLCTCVLSDTGKNSSSKIIGIKSKAAPLHTMKGGGGDAARTHSLRRL
jgi:hypothetical protein